MPLLKRAKAMLVLVVLGMVFTWVACSDPPVAPEPAGKVFTAAETDSPSPAVVSFADANLERAVRRTLKKPKGSLTTEDLASLTRLDVERQDVQNIESLAGLEHCTALDTLNLFGSEIADLSPLSGLTTLTYLNLGHNQVADLSPLSSGWRCRPRSSLGWLVVCSMGLELSPGTGCTVDLPKVSGCKAPNRSPRE